MKRCFCVVVMAICWLCTLVSRARASEDDLLIALLAGDASPEIVCVVSESPKGHVWPNVRTRKEWEARRAEEVFGESTRAHDTTAWAFSQVEPNQEPRAQHPAARARQLLFKAPDPAVAFSSQKDCAPRIQLARTVERQVFCARNPLAGPTGSTVAVLDLSYGSAPARAIDFVSMAGNLVTIRFHPLPGNPKVSHISARVGGGHFHETVYEVPSGRVAQMPLEPRCHLREVELPQIAGAFVSVLPTLKFSGGSEWGSPEVELGSRLLVALPRSESSRVALNLKIAAKPAEPPDADRTVVAVFRSVWTSKVPPVAPELRITNVAFDWHMPCEYPYPACPGVRLTSTGTVGEGTRVGNDICRYSLSSKGQSFTLPEEVTFIHKKLPEWRAQLSHVGQTLEAYLSAEKRQLVVRMPWHQQAGLEGDEIDSIEIWGPSGVRHELTPQSQYQIPMPYSSCGDRLTYRLRGTRLFEVDKVEIEGGTIDLPAPGKTASHWELGVAGGAGFMFARGQNDRPFGSLEGGLRVRPTSRWSAEHSFWTNLDYELALSYHLARQPYRPVHFSDFLEDDDFESSPYNRFLLSGYTTFLIAGAGVRLGPGVGAGLAYPVYMRHRARVGPLAPIGALAFRGRYAITDRWELIGTTRVLFFEKIYAYHSTNGLTGTPTRTVSGLAWWTLELAVQGWL